MLMPSDLPGLRDFLLLDFYYAFDDDNQFRSTYTIFEMENFPSLTSPLLQEEIVLQEGDWCQMISLNSRQTNKNTYLFDDCLYSK